MKSSSRTPGTTDTAPRLRRRFATLSEHLGDAGAFARLSDQATRLRHLQARLDVVLPAYLLPGTRVVNLKQGKLVIYADSGAVAVKLRQLAPRLTENLQQQGPEVTAIEVRVQARRPLSGGVRQKAARPITARTRNSLASLIAGLAEDSPVRQALEKLLRNH